MIRLIIICFGCCLVGCNSVSVRNPEGFEERQKQLFYEIDHKLIYQSAQELMRLHREGKLTSNIYYCDDIETKQNELPEQIRMLQPTYVQIHEVMLNIAFHHDEDKFQLLRCFSNEFGEPTSSGNDTKGLGFRKDPFGMDRLSGNESLEYLNKNYDHFQMTLIQGLMYEMYTEEKQRTLEELKQSNEFMNKMFGEMQKILDELAIKKQRLLYRTDHQELLAACRKIIKKYNDGVFSTDKINIDHKEFENDIKHIPEIIINLEPVYIWLNNNSVTVALIGGMDHAGAIVYINNDQVNTRDDYIEIIDGLYYYDDGLREANKDYKDYLKSLEKEAIPYLDWKRKQMNLSIPDETKNLR